MLIADLAAASEAVRATSSRLAKIAAIADVLSALGTDEASIAVAWLSGELRQRQIGVGYAALGGVPPPAASSTLTAKAVDDTFSQIKASVGAGSKGRRTQLLADLFAAATADEQRFLRGLLSGELRQGALAGVMTAAIARAAEVPLESVRRAAMVRGNLAAVAAAALSGGARALAQFRLEVGQPVSPMLAQGAADIDDALDRLGGLAAFETKLDGIRVQIHRDHDAVRVFTRSLDDITGRLPEAAALARSLPVTTLVADGEAIALRPDGRPQPFQVTAARTGAATNSALRSADTPITVVLFDLLHVDGRDLLDEPGQVRRAELDRLVPAEHRTARLVTADPSAAQDFLATALAAGHEGLVAKAVNATYDAGRRGAGWLKIKPVHTVDLVVLAVERGSGRRVGTLSNIHLGARAGDGTFVMLGKTFKGMTDEMLAWQTTRFTELADGPTEGYVVPVRAEQVVEIAFDGVQNSTRYPGGVALRFARVLRYRDDKTAEEADTIDTVRAFLNR
jgi:DNA ligase-1